MTGNSRGKRRPQGEPPPDPVPRPLLRGQFPRPRQCRLRRACHERGSRLHAGDVRLRRRHLLRRLHPLRDSEQSRSCTNSARASGSRRIMISWGLVATAMGFVTGETSFYALRFALGVAEAGFFPGIILYLTYWFPKEERARIVSLFMTAVPIATVFGGPLSGALLGLHGFLGIAGWRWLFVIEGIPAVLLGIVALKLLTDRPKDAHGSRRKSGMRSSERLAAEAEETRAHRLCRNRPGAHQSARDPARPALFLPGGRPLRHRLLDASGAPDLRPLESRHRFPHRHSLSRRRHRHGHRRAPLGCEGRAHLARGAAALSVAARPSPGRPMPGRFPSSCWRLSLAALGLYAAIGTFWSLPTSILTGTGAAAGLALINSIGNCGGFAGPVIVGQLKGATGDFTAALLFLAGALAVAGALWRSISARAERRRGGRGAPRSRFWLTAQTTCRSRLNPAWRKAPYNCR